MPQSPTLQPVFQRCIAKGWPLKLFQKLNLYTKYVILVANYNVPNKFANSLSFYAFKLGGHLQWRNYDEKLAAIPHVKNFHVDRWYWVNVQCRGILLIWILVGQGPTALAVGAGGCCLDIFFWSFISLFFLPLSGRLPNIDWNNVSKGL